MITPHRFNSNLSFYAYSQLTGSDLIIELIHCPNWSVFGFGDQATLAKLLKGQNSKTIDMNSR